MMMAHRKICYDRAQTESVDVFRIFHAEYLGEMCGMGLDMVKCAIWNY